MTSFSGSNWFNVNAEWYYGQNLHSVGRFTFWISPSLGGVAAYTHRPQGVIIVGIYMSSNIYYLLLYLSKKELCRRIGLQTCNCNILWNFWGSTFASLFQVCITPFSFSIVIIIINIWGHVNASNNWYKFTPWGLRVYVVIVLGERLTQKVQWPGVW